MNVLLNTGVIRAQIGTYRKEVQAPVTIGGSKQPPELPPVVVPEVEHPLPTVNDTQHKRLLSSRRISRHERKPLGNPNTFLKELTRKPILTQRDKEVLLSIYKHRCLTTEQITEIHFKYRDNNLRHENNQAAVVARRRLRKLFDYHLVDRFFIDVGEKKGSSQGHIMLDQIGAKVVAGLLNCKVTELGWRQEMNEYRLPYLQHAIEINDFYVHLLNSSRKAGHELGEFVTENLTRHEFNHWGSKFVVNPDAYGQYFIGEDGFHFFLEWDRDTMSVPTFQKKQQRYAAFYASDEYRKHYETFPIVLTVAPTVERVIKLRDCIKAVDDTDIVWFFATKEQVEKDIMRGWIDKSGSELNLIDHHKDS